MSNFNNKIIANADANFLAEVVHELRAPLGGVEAMAELLSATNLGPEQQRLVDGLRAAAAHLRAVANDVLDDAALSKGHFKCQEHVIDLNKFISTLATSVEARAKAKGLRFLLIVDDSLPQLVIGDDRRIRQMLENLLDNAIKVTTTGEVRLLVQHVDRRGAFEGLKFIVADTGPGFSEKQRQLLFTTFGKLNNGVAGTGLGLSLVRRLANAMGGEAGCESVMGCGAQFWFTLRLRVPTTTTAYDNPSEDISGHAGTGHAGNGANNSNCILIVDDNQTNRMIMAAVLEHFGYQIEEAESGEQALALIKDKNFAAVMMDQTLPGLSGVETLSEIRKLPGGLGLLPVIPVTGRVASADRKAFAAAGANGFVEKPVTARAVREALSNAFSQGYARNKTAA